MIDGVEIPHRKGQFWGKGSPIVTYSAVIFSKTAESIVMLLDWPKESWIRLDSEPLWEGEIWGKGSLIEKYRDILPWAVQKRLNWSICHLGYGLRWAEGSTGSVIFARWRQCTQFQSYSPGGASVPTWEVHWRHLANTIEPSVCGGDVVYVKLLWPFVAICGEMGYVRVHTCWKLRRSVKSWWYLLVFMQNDVFFCPGADFLVAFWCPNVCLS